MNLNHRQDRFSKRLSVTVSEMRVEERSTEGREGVAGATHTETPHNLRLAQFLRSPKPRSAGPREEGYGLCEQLTELLPLADQLTPAACITAAHYGNDCRRAAQLTEAYDLTQSRTRGAA